MFFYWSAAPPAKEAGGDSDLPLCHPAPLYPLQTAEGYPRPPLWRKGYFPLFLDRQGPYQACPLFGLRSAANRVPERARTLHGPGAGARIAARWSCRDGSLPTLQG